MGQTTFPCPACYQSQAVSHENGAEIQSRLCASCAEEADKLGFDAPRYIKAAHALRDKQAKASA